MRQRGVPVAGIVGAFLLPALESLGGVRLELLVCAGVIGVLGLIFVAYGAELAVAARQRVALRPALSAIVGSPGMARILLVAVFYIVVLQAALSYLVPSVRDAGLSPLWSSTAFFAMQVGAAISRVAWGWLADRDGGRRRVRSLTEVGITSAIGAALLAALLYVGPGAVLVAVIAFALGAMGWNALVYVSAGERAPAGLSAQSVALAATVVFAIAAASAPLMDAIAASLGWGGVLGTVRRPGSCRRSDRARSRRERGG